MEEEPGRREKGEEGESKPKERPRIYVASLSDYNQGRLYGKWIDAAQEPEELEKQVKAMLAHSPDLFAEEWAIHDDEGFGLVRLSEYESLESVSKLALGIAEHGLAFAAWAALKDNDPEALDRFKDVYLGSWESAEDYGEMLLVELGLEEVPKLAPELIAPYLCVDVESFVRDLELGGDLMTVKAPDGSVWVFDGHV